MTAPRNYRDIPTNGVTALNGDATHSDTTLGSGDTALRSDPALTVDPVDTGPASPRAPRSRQRPADRRPRSRIGGAWVMAVAFALVLLLLLIFILENGQPAEVSFFGAHGHLPMGVALLLAAVFGVLLVAVPGTARIVQLRLLGRRRSRTPLTAPITTPIAEAEDQHPPTAAP
jgi:uncharacterized integral membrane protein